MKWIEYRKHSFPLFRLFFDYRKRISAFVVPREYSGEKEEKKELGEEGIGADAPLPDRRSVIKSESDRNANSRKSDRRKERRV